MARPKTTITRDSVFKRSGSPSQPPAQGLPSEEKPRHQTSVWLTDAEIDWIDSQCHVIRRGGWRSITRSAFVRALIRASMEQATDVEGVTAEEELAQRLSGR